MPDYHHGNLFVERVSLHAVAAAVGTPCYVYSKAALQARWRAYDRASRHWQALYPQRLRVQSYEALVAEPERQVAQLLEFCGVAFDPACLRYTETPRSVRTA